MRFIGLAVAVVVLAPSGGAGAGEPAAPRAEANGLSAHTAEQVRATVEEHVRKVAAESGGAYRLRDEVAGTTLALEYVRASVVSTSALWKVHDPKHRDERRAFFACALFHLAGAPAERRYDVDLRVESRDGQLAVTDVRIHREARLVDGKWIWKERPARAPSEGR